MAKLSFRLAQLVTGEDPTIDPNAIAVEEDAEAAEDGAAEATDGDAGAADANASEEKAATT